MFGVGGGDYSQIVVLQYHNFTNFRFAVKYSSALNKITTKYDFTSSSYGGISTHIDLLQIWFQILSSAVFAYLYLKDDNHSFITFI